MDDDEPSQKLVEGSVMNPLDWREKWKRGPDTFPLNYQGRNEWKSCRGRRNGKAASKGIILHRNGDYISTKLRVLLLLWWVYDHAKRNHPSLPTPRMEMTTLKSMPQHDRPSIEPGKLIN